MEVELLQEDEADALKATEERQFALASAKVAAEDAAVGLAAVAQEAAETIVASATETMVEEAAVSQQRATLVEDLAAGAVVTEDGSDRYAALASVQWQYLDSRFSFLKLEYRGLEFPVSP